MRPTKRTVVNSYTAVFAGAAVVQGLFARRFARWTKWGHNDGWQREIAIWNLGALTAISALRRANADVDGSLIAGFALMSALFGTNHLSAALRSERSLGNWAGAIGNGVGLAAALAALAGRASR